ncbi:MAG: glycosyltransferase family protein [Rhodothermales bacterium]
MNLSRNTDNHLPPFENHRSGNRPLRIALYSHDTCGLGHMRRNLLIAQTLAEQFPSASILLVTGAREVSSFQFPERVDAVSLPSLYKKANEVYAARSLDIDISDLIHLRSCIIKTSIEAFNPDVFIVDKVPRGTMGELDETLAYLAQHTKAHCVLGLRDILDSPEITKAEWAGSRNTETIEKYYDSIWVYGDTVVHDLASAYSLSDDISRRMTYVGYLNPSVRLEKANPDAQDNALLDLLGDQFYLCAVGGGQDGMEVSEAFANASFPAGVNGLIVTGPHMPPASAARLQELVDTKDHLTLVTFLPEPLHVYTAAKRIVAMGGYNTTLELLGIGARALIVPRVYPRAEQWIRSDAMQKLGLLDYLHPDELSAGSISDWFSAPVKKIKASEIIDMDGLKRIPELVRSLVSERTASVRKQDFARSKSEDSESIRGESNVRKTKNSNTKKPAIQKHHAIN